MLARLKGITSKTYLKRDYKVPPVPNTIWKNPLHFIAFGFGTGALPIAPGAFGTLIAIPFYLYLASFSQFTYVILTLIISLASIWLCQIVSNDLQIEDHQGMCLDEIVGFLITMCYAPYGLGWISLGFILFRLFDIWKPWPINLIDEKIHGGVGMILDDALAGLYSCLIIQLIARII